MGHVTLVEGDRVRTGVTVIVPHGGNLFQEKVPGAVFVGNAFGKLAGPPRCRARHDRDADRADEHARRGTAVEAIVGFTLAQPGNEDVRSVNALVGETNDGRLNDIRASTSRATDVLAALARRPRGPVAEGTWARAPGAVAFGWKGGIGTASRRLPAGLAATRSGVLVQANFGGVLIWTACPWAATSAATRRRQAPAARADAGDGSCMIVVATDAPLDARDLSALAARAVFGLARTGSSFSNGSGDYAIAFSTADRAARPPRRGRRGARGRFCRPRAVAVVPGRARGHRGSRAQRPAAGDHVSGMGRSVEAIPLDRVRDALSKYGGPPPQGRAAEDRAR